MIRAKDFCMMCVKGQPQTRPIKLYINETFVGGDWDGIARKPEDMHTYAEKMFGEDGKYLEIFARRKNLRTGWVSIGDKL